MRSRSYCDHKSFILTELSFEEELEQLMKEKDMPELQVEDPDEGGGTTNADGPEDDEEPGGSDDGGE